MATSKATRIGIWFIAVFMLVGTIGSFAVMVLANDNQRIDDQRKQDLLAEYQAEVSKQASDLSAKYYDTFSKYSDAPAVFSADSVKKLATKDLLVGDGEEIKEGTAYSAYYVGWNPDGVVFDGSIEGDKLKSPIPGSGLIEGWTEGVIGMKLGGVREISIPSDKAYGEQGSGENIPPNTPIKFIVMAIPAVDEIQPSEELVRVYGQ